MNIQSNITTRSFAMALHLTASGIEPLKVQSLDDTRLNVLYTFPPSARSAMQHYFTERDKLNTLIDTSRSQR